MHTIVYFGHHKCASTYISAVMLNISRLLGLRAHIEFLSKRLPLGYENYPDQVSRIETAYHMLETRRYDLLCHGNADNSVVTALNNRGPFRGFHVIRDPRDIIVSGYFWHKSANSIGRDKANQWNMERMKRLQSAPNEEHGLLMELEFSASYMATLGAWNYQRGNTLEMKYEDMISNRTEFFSTAFKFVGLPPVIRHNLMARWGIALNRVALNLRCRPLVRVSTLSALLLNQSLDELSFEKQSPGHGNGVANPGHKYRKGVAGDWRSHFTPRVTAVFKERYGHLLRQLGYEKDDNWS